LIDCTVWRPAGNALALIALTAGEECVKLIGAGSVSAQQPAATTGKLTVQDGALRFNDGLSRLKARRSRNSPRRRSKLQWWKPGRFRFPAEFRFAVYERLVERVRAGLFKRSTAPGTVTPAAHRIWQTRRELAAVFGATASVTATRSWIKRSPEECDFLARIWVSPTISPNESRNWWARRF